MKQVLLTGAAGGVGTFLRHELADQYRLRLSDRVAIDDCRDGEEFVLSDLTSLESMRKAVKGVEAIIHLGGYSVEGDWDSILQANIIGAHNLFEAAHLEGVKRIVFASSNHAMGFYGRDETIDHTALPRPDSRYGLSKVFGESLAQLYVDKYDLEVLSIRIGNVGERPLDVRRLAIWISPRDFAQPVCIGLEHADIKNEIVYGMSDNKRAWWDNSNALRLGYAPVDKSEDYAAEILAAHNSDADHTLSETLQGGVFVTAESIPNPAKPVADDQV
jgi:uronate dehydrogenase